MRPNICASVSLSPLEGYLVTHSGCNYCACPRALLQSGRRRLTVHGKSVTVLSDPPGCWMWSVVGHSALRKTPSYSDYFQIPTFLAFCLGGQLPTSYFLFKISPTLKEKERGMRLELRRSGGPRVPVQRPSPPPPAPPPFN